MTRGQSKDRKITKTPTTSTAAAATATAAAVIKTRRNKKNVPSDKLST